MSEKVELRTPLITLERVKLSAVLIGYAVLAELADPTPFYATGTAKLLYYLLILEVARQWFTWRLEVSRGAVLRQQRRAARWARFRDRFSSDARHRARRALYIVVGLLVFGWALDALTDRCMGAFQCAMLFPRLAIEQVPQALRVALYMAIGISQFVALLWAMTKVGFVKLVYPGTIDVSFGDIYGQDAAVEKVREQVDLLEDDEAVQAAGGYMPKGVLLWGPPGTGKTMLAKAAANASTKPLILVPPGAFAPQPDSATVWTPDGPQKLGDVHVGDWVLGSDGQPVKVVGITTYGPQPVYRLVTDDGASTLCHPDHLWRVTTPDGEASLSASEMLARGVRRPHGSNKRPSWRFKVPLMSGPAQFGTEGPDDLPIHPYVLGALLGDGSFRGSSVMMKAEKRPTIVERMKTLLPEWLPWTENPSRGNQGSWTIAGLHLAIKHLELWGLGSADKFIPERYLLANPEARLELLRGLMDTDGDPAKGYPRFSSRSPDLAESVAYLVRSLGGKASITERPHLDAPMFFVNIRCPVNPFWVEDKASQYREREFAWQRSIVAIDAAGTEPVRCIQVATPDHLYVTDDFLVTHNSTFVGINFLKVWQLFRMIRRYAVRWDGVIVFIDEIDSLGHRGGEVTQDVPSLPECAAVSYPAGHTSGGEAPVIIGGGTGAGQMGTLEAFLAAMDGMEEPRGLVNKVLRLLGFKPLPPPRYRYMMLGATNRISAIDPALLRAGRFGRKIRVGYPKFDGRLATYQGYLGKIDHSLTDDQVEWAARNHYKGTGAEIQDIVNEALLITFREDRDGAVSFRDVMRAMVQVRYGESDGPFERPRNQWGVAVHEAGHAVAMHYLLRERADIWLATCEQHGTTGGFVAPSPHWDDWKAFRSEMLADIQVSLASRVAEDLFFGEMSNGHGGDGPAATRKAEQMVRLGHTYDPETGEGQISFVDDRRKDDYQDRVEAILRDALDATYDLLRPRTYQVAAVASLLWGEGTVPGDRIHELLNAMEPA